MEGEEWERRGREEAPLNPERRGGEGAGAAGSRERRGGECWATLGRWEQHWL
jgi:hypothetical protein